MRYNSVVARAITAGAFTNYLFSCNGLFDPDLTGTGTSVLYFAQLAAIYDHYTVISSSITVEPTANNTNTNTVIALYQDDDTSVPLNLQTALARPGATSCTNNFAISKAPKLYSKWSAASTFGNTQHGQILNYKELSQPIQLNKLALWSALKIKPQQPLLCYTMSRLLIG